MTDTHLFGSLAMIPAVKVWPIRSRGDWTRMVVVLIVVCHAAALAWLGCVEAPVWHEPAQLAAGLCGWSFGRSDMIRVNPPFVRLVAAAPVLFLHPILDPNDFDRPPGGRDEFARAERFVKDNAAHFRHYLTLARWVCISFSLAGAYFCWRMGAMLYGPCSGLVALILWCCRPYILGHGATIMADVPAAAMCVGATYCFWRWLKRPQWLEAIIAGLVLGLAELCKFTLLVLYPLLPALWIAYRLPERKMMNKRDWLQQGGMLATTLLVSVYVINCGYLFENSFTPLEEFRFQTMMFTGCGSLKEVPPEGANRFAGTWMGKARVPLPADFLQGIDAQCYDFDRGLPSYLRGGWADHGWWYYYLYALAIKEPLGIWVLVATAIGMTIFAKGYSVARRDEIVVIGPFIVILVFVSSQTGFSVHSRYIIPALPFLSIWVSKIARAFETRPFTRERLAMAITVALMLAWSVGSSLAIYPHSLSYFNELGAVLPTPEDSSYPVDGENQIALTTIKDAVSAGALNGPRHLLDSNIDWGQDLFHLEDWLDAHPEAKLDGLAYYGSYSATLTRIPETPMPATGREYERLDPNQPQDQLGPQPGWYALSVNYLYDRSRQYRYFLNFKPVAMAGYSIYIYHISIDEANRVRRELGLPRIEDGREEREEELNGRGEDWRGGGQHG